MMKKIIQLLSLVISVSSVMNNIFVANAGGSQSTQKNGVSHASLSSKTSQLTRANTTNGCFLFPTNEALLKQYTKKEYRISDYYNLPPIILSKVKELIATGSKIIDEEKTTHRTGTRIFTFIKDAYSDSDTAAISAFANRLLDTKTVSKTTAYSTDITCRYSDFIIGAYTTIHSDKLLNCSEQLKALQMVFAGLKEQNKYMLDQRHTDRLLELNADMITKFALTLIRTPIDPILQPGDCAILIEFPDISILYTIR